MRISRVLEFLRGTEPAGPSSNLRSDLGFDCEEFAYERST